MASGLGSSVFSDSGFTVTVGLEAENSAFGRRKATPTILVARGAALLEPALGFYSDGS